MFKNQQGIAPLFVIILVVLAGAGFFIIAKNLPKQSAPTSPANFQASNSAQTKSASPSASASLTAKKTKPTPIATNNRQTNSATPTPKPNTGSSVNNSNNSSDSSNNSASNNNANPAPTSTPAPTPTAVPSNGFSHDGIEVKITCSGSNMQVAISSSIPSSPSYSEGVWGAIVDNNTEARMIYTYVGGGGGNYPINISANFPPTHSIRGSNVDLIADGRPYSVRAYYAPYTDSVPALGNAIARVDFSKTCP